jgi:hypothetical protein
MQMLRSRLYEIELKKNKRADMKQEKWKLNGDQIRNYVMQPIN